MTEFERQGRLVYSKRGMPRLKNYLDERNGVPMAGLWDDIPPINSQAQAQADGSVRLEELVFHHRGSRPVYHYRDAWAKACIRAGLFHVVTDAKGKERKVPGSCMTSDARRCGTSSGAASPSTWR